VSAPAAAASSAAAKSHFKAVIDAGVKSPS
jgi:hypothetical protein